MHVQYADVALLSLRLKAPHSPLVPPSHREILGGVEGVAHDAFASGFVVKTDLVDIAMVADHNASELQALSGASFHQIGEMNGYKVFRHALSNHYKQLPPPQSGIQKIEFLDVFNN